MNLDQKGQQQQAEQNFEFIVNKVEMKEKWLRNVNYE